MEKRGTDILAMCSCCRGANREVKVTNSGVPGCIVKKRRPRGREVMDLPYVGGRIVCFFF